jgi:hypothetical protein
MCPRQDTQFVVERCIAQEAVFSFSFCAAQDYNSEALTMLTAPNLQLNASLHQVMLASS